MITDVAIDKVHTTEVGRGPVLGFGAAVVVGCLLFAVSRRLTWGVDEPLWDSMLWSWAFGPYAVYILLGRTISPAESAAAMYLRLSLVWTVSLALYVLAHATALARLFENPIYDAFGLSQASFAMLTAIYVTASLILSWAAEVARRRDAPDREAARSLATLRRRALILGYLIALPMFLLFVFVLPLHV